MKLGTGAYAGDDSRSGVSAGARQPSAALGGARVQLHRPDPSVSRILLSREVTSRSAAPKRPLPKRRATSAAGFSRAPIVSASTRETVASIRECRVDSVSVQWRKPRGESGHWWEEGREREREGQPVRLRDRSQCVPSRCFLFAASSSIYYAPDRVCR